MENNKEMELDQLAVDAFALYGRTFRLQAPHIMVRVLPREQATASGIVLTGVQQNKPVEEGIVVSVYEPKTLVSGRVRTPSVAVGEHVLFPSYAGVPPPRMVPEKRYRMIPEDLISAVIEYDQPTMEEQIMEWFKTVRIPVDLPGGLTELSKAPSAEEISRSFAQQLLRSFWMTPVEVAPKTTSGV